MTDNKFRAKHIFTPGPVPMHPETLAVGGRQTPYFRNKAFSQLLLDCEDKLLHLLNAPPSSRVVFFTASGTAAMEAAVINLLDLESRPLVINGGGFGQRFIELCKRQNFGYEELCIREDDLSDTTALEAYVRCDSLLINAHETSVGLKYNLDKVGSFCRENQLLHIVDAISAFVTDPIDMSRHAIDAVILSSHKGLALPPGLSMLVLSSRAQKNLKSSPSLYFDCAEYLRNGLRGQTPYTPAVTIVLQLHARLCSLVEGGIVAAQQHAANVAAYFRKEISGLPLKPSTRFMPNAMTTLTPTDGRSAADIVSALEQDYDVVITPSGGELRDKIFRVSHMGNCDKAYTDVLIDALFRYYGRKRTG